MVLMGCTTASDTTVIQSAAFLELSYPKDMQLIQRAEWGWKATDLSYKTHQIQYITVHHGGVDFPDSKDSTQHVKNLQSWSRSEKKWFDIPYHFMIDREGNVFETRPINIPGDTNTEYDPTSHALVEVMGNYQIQEMTDIQYTAMIKLLKFLSVRFEVPANRIKTHKDYSTQTECPGKNIYTYFTDGTIEKAITETSGL